MEVGGEKKMQKKYSNQLSASRTGVSVILGNRGEAELTQERLAKLCGVSRQTIWSIESELAMPSYPLAIKIYSILRKVDTDLKLTALFPLSRQENTAKAPSQTR